MPGYDNKVIWRGSLYLGSSIELSADAPLREPFAVWLREVLTSTAPKSAYFFPLRKC